MPHHLEEMHLLLNGKNNLVCTGSLALQLASIDSILLLFPPRDQMNPTLDFPNSSFHPSSIIPCISFTAWGWVLGTGMLKKNTGIMWAERNFHRRKKQTVKHPKFLQASVKIFSSYPVGWREVWTFAFQGEQRVLPMATNWWNLMRSYRSWIHNLFFVVARQQKAL